MSNNHDKDLLSRTPEGRAILAQEGDRVARLEQSIAEHARNAPSAQQRAAHSQHSTGRAIVAAHDLADARLRGLLHEAKRGKPGSE